MKINIEIVEKEIGNVLEIQENANMFQMPKLFKKNLMKIFDYLQANNASDEKCLPYGRYINTQWNCETKKSFISKIKMMFKKWDIRIGIQATAKLNNENNIKYDFINKRKYVKSIHTGPYHKLGSTYEEMISWSLENNITLDDQAIEMYLNDPETVKKEDLKTEILMAIQ